MPELKKLTLIEGICYLHPHKPEIVASHPAMKGTWKLCRQLLKENAGSFMAPLLIDGLERDGKICDQTIDDLLKPTPQDRWPWFGKPVMEAEIAKQFDNLGCKFYDVIYHELVLASLSMACSDWKWISVNPVSFKEQQAGMLKMLWKRMIRHIDFSILSQTEKIKSEDMRDRLRGEFLGRFEHQWISDAGEVIGITHPRYRGGKIVHL